MSMGFDAGAFKRNLVYTRSAPVETILEDLAAIHGLVAKQAKSGFLSGLVIALSIMGILGGFVGLVVGAETRSDTVFRASGIAIVASVVLLIVAVVWRSLKKGKTPVPKRAHLVDRVLRLLERDIGKGVPIDVKMDVRSPARSEVFTGKGQAGHWDAKYYEDPWLELSGRFADKTSFNFGLTEKHQARHRVKRSASGKRKSKTKSKSSHLAALRLKPKPEAYQFLDQIGPSAAGAVKLPRFAEPKEITVAQGQASLKAVARADWKAPAPGEPDEQPSGTDLVAMMFLSLYHVLNLSREVTKKVA